MLPKENRLKKDKDFKILFSKGEGVYGSVCGIKFRKNKQKNSRIAVIVGTKVSKSAVKRNRIRRQVRENIRLRLQEIMQGYDIAVIVGPKAVGQTRKEMEKQTFLALNKAKLLKRV